MIRSIKGFRVSWVGQQRVLAEWETAPKHKYGFEVSTDWSEVGELYLHSPVDVAEGDPLEDAERFDEEARKAVEEFLRLEREGKLRPAD